MNLYARRLVKPSRISLHAASFADVDEKSSHQPNSRVSFEMSSWDRPRAFYDNTGGNARICVRAECGEHD